MRDLTTAASEKGNTGVVGNIIGLRFGTGSLASC